MPSCTSEGLPVGRFARQPSKELQHTEKLKKHADFWLFSNLGRTLPRAPVIKMEQIPSAPIQPRALG